MKYVVLYSQGDLIPHAEEFDTLSDAVDLASECYESLYENVRVGTFTPIDWQKPSITKIRTIPGIWANRSLVLVNVFEDGEMEPGHTVTGGDLRTRVYIDSLGAIFVFPNSRIRWDNDAMDRREQLVLDALNRGD